MVRERVKRIGSVESRGLQRMAYPALWSSYFAEEVSLGSSR